eukprot:5801565-Karenia_brevis.AAC.1
MLAPSLWILRRLDPMLDCLGSMLGHVGCWVLCTRKRSVGQSYAQASLLGHPQTGTSPGEG